MITYQRSSIEWNFVIFDESNQEKGETSDDNHFKFTEDEGAQFVNESILKQRLVNGKKQFLLKLSSGTVTRTQSPNQRDVPDKLLRKWTKTGRKGRSEMENPERTITKSERSKEKQKIFGKLFNSVKFYNKFVFSGFYWQFMGTLVFQYADPSPIFPSQFPPQTQTSELKEIGRTACLPLLVRAKPPTP